MENNNLQNNSVPYIAHESMMARLERINRRLLYALIVAIIMIFASNLAWLYNFMQYDYSSEQTITIDGKEGTANYIGNDGSIYNGQDSNKEGPEEDKEE
jgi:hypothetical protein